jgi:hypothetical protein
MNKPTFQSTPWAQKFFKRPWGKVNVDFSSTCTCVQRMMHRMSYDIVGLQD